MTMVPRDPITQKQIDAAKGKPGPNDPDPAGEDSEAVQDAEKSVDETPRTRKP